MSAASEVTFSHSVRVLISPTHARHSPASGCPVSRVGWITQRWEGRFGGHVTDSCTLQFPVAGGSTPWVTSTNVVATTAILRQKIIRSVISESSDYFVLLATHREIHWHKCFFYVYFPLLKLKSHQLGRYYCWNIYSIVTVLTFIFLFVYELTRKFIAGKWYYCGT